MATHKKLTIGEVITGSLDVMKRNKWRIFLYALIISPLFVAWEWISPLNHPEIYSVVQRFSFKANVEGLPMVLDSNEIILYILMLIAQYILWRSVMKGEGIIDGISNIRVFAFIGLHIITSIFIIIGLILLIVPGFILMARWSIAPAMLLEGPRTFAQSMRDSWDAVKGNTAPIALVIFGYLGLMSLITFTLLEYKSYYEIELYSAIGFVGIAAEQLLGTFGTILSIALGCFLFRYFVESANATVEVFE